jgi:hypothetical protein
MNKTLPLTDDGLREAILAIPQLREAILAKAATGWSIDKVVDVIIRELRTADLKKTRRKVEEALRQDPLVTYQVATSMGIFEKCTRCGRSVYCSRCDCT